MTTGHPTGSGVATLPGWQERSAGEWAPLLDVPLLELHTSLPSTNDRPLELAEEGALPFTTVVAGEQTRGRGRGGKRWHSPPGRGLWVSVLLPLPSDGGPGVTTLAAGVAAAEAVEAVGGILCSLKWPNDLFLPGASGRAAKVGGILCERRGSGRGVVAGVGINLLRGATPLAGSTTVEEASGRRPTPSELAAHLLQALRRWGDPPPGEVGAKLRRAWAARDLLSGREVEAEVGVRGRAVGIAPDGALLVRTAQGSVQPVRGGSVRLVGPEGKGSEVRREGS